MRSAPRSEWRHWTAPSIADYEPDGVDLFDDEDTNPDGLPQVTIYIRNAAGERYGARSVNMADAEHARTVLTAWANRGPVHDYRAHWHGEHVQGLDMRGDA